MDEEVKYLTEVEMLKLELEAEKEKVRKKDERLVLAENDLLHKTKELIDEKLKNCSHRYRNVCDMNDKQREKRKEFMSELKEKYGIPEEQGLGYDPISGELIVNVKKDV